AAVAIARKTEVVRLKAMAAAAANAGPPRARQRDARRRDGEGRASAQRVKTDARTERGAIGLAGRALSRGRRRPRAGPRRRACKPPSDTEDFAMNRRTKLGIERLLAVACLAACSASLVGCRQGASTTATEGAAPREATPAVSHEATAGTLPHGAPRP